MMIPIQTILAVFLQCAAKELGRHFYHVKPMDPLQELPVNGDCLLTMDDQGYVIFTNENGAVAKTLVASVNLPDETYHCLPGLTTKFATIGEAYRHYYNNGKEKRRPIKMDLYAITKKDIQNLVKIGGGNFGIVSKGLYREMPVAVKEPKMPENFATATPQEQEKMVKAVAEEKQMLRRENATMKDLADHACIVRIFGANFAVGQDCLFLELMSGTLLDFVKPMNDGQIVRCIYQVALGLSWVHSMGYVHRDLAGRNILYNMNTDEVKIGDFGLSEKAVAIQLTPTSKITVRWSAPEAIKSHKYTVASDTWSFAMVVFELINRNLKKPYTNLTEAEVRVTLNGMKLENMPKIEETWPQPLQKIFYGCLDYDPSARPLMDDVARQIFALDMPNKGRLPSPAPPVGLTSPPAVEKTPEKTGEKTPKSTPKTTPQKKPDAKKSSPGKENAGPSRSRSRTKEPTAPLRNGSTTPPSSSY